MPLGSVMVTGHSTLDALRLLRDELQKPLDQHQLGMKSFSEGLRFLHHSKAYSLLHWTSISLVAISSFLLLIAFAGQTTRNNWLVFEALILLILLILTIYFVAWDNRLRRTEIISKANNVLSKLEACIKEGIWSSSNYIDLNCPLSQCVSLQWTIRDSSVINLPSGFLVEGDVILLRPGQVVPAKCRKMKTGDDEDDLEYNAGDLYNPAQNLPELEMYSKIEAREPLKPQAFLVLETPFVKNFKQILKHSHDRPVGMLDNERYAAYSIWCERRLIPVIAFLTLLTNTLRFVLLKSYVGDWAEMIIVLTVNSIIPLLAYLFPIVWRLLDSWGVAKVVFAFQESINSNNGKVRSPSGDSFKSEATLDNKVELNVSWKDLYIKWKDVLSGQTDTLPRTANLVQVLGNMTSFCCVDKKGVLSWPNPTAEKVFILTSQQSSHSTHHRSKHLSDKSKTPDHDLHDAKIQRHDHNNEHFPAEVSFQVLDLTQDMKNDYGLRFDDSSWRKYLNSLKPLGLNILLNTCNMETTYKYTEFADHVTCISLKREEAVPVVNRRCFCELAHQIGFNENAGSYFKTQQTLGMYRHIPPDSNERKLESSKSFIKHKMPMPNVFGVVVKDNYTDASHLFSQGMADLLLDACSDFWDGQKLKPLGNAERKKIADFYHRTSMSSYCTAFAYRPCTEVIGEEFADIYLEVPDDVITFHGPLHNRMCDTQHINKRHNVKDRLYHGSAESLILDGIVPDIHDVEGCFQSQSNQVFIGMITMQYQAKQDIVDLIESLESTCIRFVHFSKENELRSRVFSEKMGLEAGWNCHISLLSEKHSSDVKVDESDAGIVESSIGYDSQDPLNDSMEFNDFELDFVPLNRHLMLMKENRYSSAPEIALIYSQNDKSPVSPDRAALRLSHELVNSGLQEYLGDVTSGRGSDLVSVSVPLLRQKPGKTSLESIGRRRHPSERALQEQRRISTNVLKSESKSSLHKMTRKRSSGDRQSSSYSAEQFDERATNAINGENETDELIRDNNYAIGDIVSDSCKLSRASSYSDSSGAALGLNNRAKLPRGIENIRPHINNVDNVPLQVSLFTDCTAHTTQEMLCILQEYGEVTCCIGSSANIENTGVFLQADCSFAVEPTYPQICIHHKIIDQPLLPSLLSPMQLSAQLHALPCSLYFASDDHLTIIRLVALARHHCQRVRSVSKFYLMCQVSLSIIQLLNSVILLPPSLPPNLLLWLSAVVVPLFSLTLMGNPINTQIIQMAQDKNRTQFTKQTILEELIYFVICYLPTLAVCLICHGLNLFTFCQHKILPSFNITCHFMLGPINYGESNEGMWNGWYGDHKSGLVLSQQIITFQLVLCFLASSLCSIHRLSYLWQKSPFVNRLWCIIAPLIIILQLIFFAANFGSSNATSEVIYSLSDVPIFIWVLVFVWPLVLIALHELVKRREIKIWVRHQKRARLDFGTKLGMNSPF